MAKRKLSEVPDCDHPKDSVSTIVDESEGAEVFWCSECGAINCGGNNWKLPFCHYRPTPGDVHFQKAKL
jgi:hypothetical protein